MKPDMNLVIFMLSLISYCLCLSGNTGNIFNKKNTTDGVIGMKCFLRVQSFHMPNMPIPFMVIRQRPSIIYPNKRGQLVIKPGQNFYLSCTNGRFQESNLQNTNEVMVTCFRENSLKIYGSVYNYDYFKCNETPKSTMIVTEKKCQNDKYTILAVGFQTNFYFITLYKVCFDMSTKHSLYTWYYTRVPYYNNHQRTTKRTFFTELEYLYGSTDVNRLYTFYAQRNTLTKTLRSNELASKYIKDDNQHLFSRGHYTGRADFFFFFEQSATYNLANTAPQWHIFNSNEWSDLEEAFRRILQRYNTKLLIVTGSFGVCTLPDIKGIQRPLFLERPYSIPVPLFFWKLVYDTITREGTVFIGLNNPYIKVDKNIFICPNICQVNNNNSPIGNTEDLNNGLIYCCTKSTFETAYGIIDPNIYNQF